MRETAEAKGRRYLTEGRLIITHLVENRVTASIRGDGTVHLAAYSDGEWRCTCPARTPNCSHLIALRLCTAPDLQRIP